MSITYADVTANMDARIAHIFDQEQSEKANYIEQLALAHQTISNLTDELIKRTEEDWDDERVKLLRETHNQDARRHEKSNGDRVQSHNTSTKRVDPTIQEENRELREDRPESDQDHPQSTRTTQTGWLISSLLWLNHQQAQQIEIVTQERDAARESDHMHMVRIANLESMLDWFFKIMRHPMISASAKLAIFAYFYTVSTVRVDWRDKFEIHMEGMASMIGMSVDSLRRINKFLQEHQLARFTSEITTNKDGEYRTHVSIELSDALASPELIEIQIDEDKRHGGKRTKLCSKCNHEVDVYTVHHCRHCDQVAWFATPGQSHEADVRQAQNAVAAQVAYVQATFDALNAMPTRDIPLEELPPVEEIEIDLPELLTERPQKQDAFSPRSDQDSNILTSIFECSCMTCGGTLQTIKRGGFTVTECPDCDKDLDQS